MLHMIPISIVRRFAASFVLIGFAASAQAQAAAPETDKKDFSAAERLLFMSNQLRTVKAPATLRYSFRKTGSLEEGFEDVVGVALSPQADGSCCAGKASFFTGPRTVQMPELEGGEGNPVTMYFLERDVREMQRLTKGSQNYFRKRIRMAIYSGAAVREASFSYKGRAVNGTEITISPYRDDPMSERYKKLDGKQYQFMLSDAVPGGVYGIRTRVDGAPGAAAPMLLEELLIDGADRAATKP